jgi:hypothetical protein
MRFSTVVEQWAMQKCAEVNQSIQVNVLIDQRPSRPEVDGFDLCPSVARRFGSVDVEPLQPL